MDPSTTADFGETEFSALNAKVAPMSKRDWSAWEEAVDWGVPDGGIMGPSEWRRTTAPDFD